MLAGGAGGVVADGRRRVNVLLVYRVLRRWRGGGGVTPQARHRRAVEGTLVASTLTRVLVGMCQVFLENLTNRGKTREIKPNKIPTFP